MLSLDLLSQTISNIFRSLPLDETIYTELQNTIVTPATASDLSIYT